MTLKPASSLCLCKGTAYRACWALKDTDLAVTCLKHIVHCSHELLLHIVRRVRMMEVELLQITRNNVNIFVKGHRHVIE